MHKLSPGVIDSYERAATGLYLPPGRAHQLGRHTALQAGAINDHQEVWDRTEQLLTLKRRNKRTADFDLDHWIDEAIWRRHELGDRQFSITHDIARRLDMRMEAGYVNAVAWQRASGTLFTTYTTAKRVILDTAIWSVPPNYLVPGRKLRVRIFGAISNIVTTPGLFNLQLRLGTIATPIAAFDTGNIQLNATAHTILPFFADIVVCAQVEGITTTAKLMGMCDISGIMITRTAGQTDDAQGVQELIAPATSPAQGTGYDSTINNFQDIASGFTISNAGNGIQIHTYSNEVLN
jgi:hypothetical protein